MFATAATARGTQICRYMLVDYCGGDLGRPHGLSTRLPIAGTDNQCLGASAFFFCAGRCDGPSGDPASATWHKSVDNICINEKAQLLAAAPGAGRGPQICHHMHIDDVTRPCHMFRASAGPPVRNAVFGSLLRFRLRIASVLRPCTAIADRPRE